jgi:hypothetical protein
MTMSDGGSAVAAAQRLRWWRQRVSATSEAAWQNIVHWSSRHFFKYLYIILDFVVWRATLSYHRQSIARLLGSKGRERVSIVGGHGLLTYL